jgi:hypothetical protein
MFTSGIESIALFNVPAGETSKASPFCEHVQLYCVACEDEVGVGVGVKAADVSVVVALLVFGCGVVGGAVEVLVGSQHETVVADGNHSSTCERRLSACDT